MNIKEQIKSAILNPLRSDEDKSEWIEKMSDDVSICFADWINKERFTMYGNSWTNKKYSKDKNGNWLFFTSKQLLEMFKKESEL